MQHARFISRSTVRFVVNLSLKLKLLGRPARAQIGSSVAAFFSMSAKCMYICVNMNGSQ